MDYTLVTKIVTHRFNGFEDAVKTVEVDGKKFLADDTDPTKPKLDDKQQPVPFVEKKVEDIKIEDYSKAELAELAKVNPKVAELLDAENKRKDKETKDEKARKEKEEKDAAEKGEWQKLADSRKGDLEKVTAERDQKEEQLGKYVETTKKVLEGLRNSIPKENLGLIPADFSPRQQLEYIIANAERLGAKVNAINGKIDKNEVVPTGTDEDKLQARITELTDKAQKRTATSGELQELRQAGMKLTELKREAAAKK